MVWSRGWSAATFTALGGFGEEGLVEAGRIIGGEVGGEKKVGGEEGECQERYELTISILPTNYVY